MQSLPITVLNTNMKRETGKKAQFANIAAAKVIGMSLQTIICSLQTLQQHLGDTLERDQG